MSSRKLSQRKHPLTFLSKALLVLGVISMGLVLVSQLDLRRSLRHMNLRMLSGPAEGHYARIVDAMSLRAKAQGGSLQNLRSEGTGENLQRLSRVSGHCEGDFALVQGGSQLTGAKFRLVARLPRQESLMLVGKKADSYNALSSLQGLKVGVGPEKGGTANLARDLIAIPEISKLGLQLEYHSIAEQLALAEGGKLDLAAFVMDEDAVFIESAIRDRGLELVGLQHADVVARRLPYVHHGRIGAGQFDAVRMLPPVDKRVLRVETLVLASECAKRSQTIDLLSALTHEFPDLVRHNKTTPNRTGLELSSAAKSYLDNDGPEPLDAYAPWLVDVMPPANWAYVLMGVSVLFNVMGFGHRFRLWRIDASRVRIESDIAALFGPKTMAEIAALGPVGRDGRPMDSISMDEIGHLIEELESLANRSRKQSLSMLVPMGQEMAYRYQETLIYEAVAALRSVVRSRVA